MPQSLAKILIHLVYSTKNRVPIIGDDIRDDLHRYTATVLHEWHSPAILINSMEDHIHILYSHSKNHSPAKIVEEVKKATSKWLKTQGQAYEDFYWQNGYGDFSVSQSNVPVVTNYIANQREHHRRTTFQDEYREFLRRHEIEFDERYVWD
jgi:REP element-mobilizing transposase RayT